MSSAASLVLTPALLLPGYPSPKQTPTWFPLQQAHTFKASDSSSNTCHPTGGSYCARSHNPHMSMVCPSGVSLACMVCGAVGTAKRPALASPYVSRAASLVLAPAACAELAFSVVPAWVPAAMHVATNTDRSMVCSSGASLARMVCAAAGTAKRPALASPYVSRTASLVLAPALCVQLALQHCASMRTWVPAAMHRAAKSPRSMVCPSGVSLARMVCGAVGTASWPALASPYVSRTASLVLAPASLLPGYPSPEQMCRRSL
jgi:hypothetical protein